MRRIVAAAVVSLLAGGAAGQDGNSPARVADRVAAAFRDRDEAALAAIARSDQPDPWLVADELCFRGEHDAAAAFARAATRPATGGLSAYVAGRRSKPPDEAARRAREASADALHRRDLDAALRGLRSVAGPLDTVDRVVLAYRAGVVLRRMRRLEESAAALRRAGAAARARQWRAAAAAAFHDSGVSAHLRGDARGALAAWNDRLACVERMGDRRLLAESLGNVATGHKHAGNNRKALEIEQRVLAIFEEVGDHRQIAMTHNNLGQTYAALGRVAMAEEHLLRALKEAEAIGHADTVARALTGLGIVARRRGRFEESLDRYRRARDAFATLNRQHDVGAATANIATVLVELGRYEKALEEYRRAGELGRTLGSQVLVDTATFGTGSVLRQLGRYEEALALLHRALASAEALGDRRRVTSALNTIAAVHRDFGQHAEALECLHRALALAEAQDSKDLVATTLTGLGNSAQRVGQYAAAFELYRRALEIARAAGDRRTVAGTHNNLGNTHLMLGQFEEALAHFATALPIVEDIGDRESTALTLGNKGHAHLALGQHAEALATYRRAFDLAKELGNRAGEARALNSIGVAHEVAGAYDEALDHFGRAVALASELGLRSIEANARVGTGNALLSSGDARAAIEAFQRARATLDEQLAPEAHARALWGLARAHLAGGAAAKAAAAAREGALLAARLSEGLAEEEGASARDVFAGLYEDGLRAALAAGDTSAAAWFCEHGRAGTLREAFGARDALQAALPTELRAALASVRARERRAIEAFRRALGGRKRDELRVARAGLAEARDGVAGVIARVQREAKSMAELVFPEPHDLDTVRGHLRPGEALVSYGFAGDEALALVVEAGGARVVPLGASREIRALLDDLLLPSAPYVAPAAAAALAERIVAPLRLGKEVRRVLVSPAGRLGYAPFALLAPDREVVYVPSGTTYGLLRAQRAGPGRGVLGLGDPDHRGMAALPATRDEVESVADVKLLGEAATEHGLARALATRARWRAVHLACHGRIDPDRAMFSALAVTPAEKHDGLLTCHEIIRMKVEADLVVLSACETARGSLYRAEGVIGLARSFMIAGSPRVLVSLWKVDDRATKALMTRFYELWKAGEIPAAAALRRAQKHVTSREAWRHPYYWAAWQLWGLPE